MNVLIAIDSFKGSLSSMQAGQAAAAGIKRVYPDAEIMVRPIADGGEGTVDALVSGMGGEMQYIPVTGPLGQIVEAAYGIIYESRTAIIEMSAAAGITLVSAAERNPMNTTTYGVGEIILDAIRKGCRNFVVGIGGSATNDGGFGMLQALGFAFLDKEGKPIPLGGRGLEYLDHITVDGAAPELRECTFHIACDVTNPLCGEKGCSAIFGPQKGADPQMIVQLDQWLERYAALVKDVMPMADKDAAGAGAAGGIGFAFLAFLNGQLKNGIELILRETKLEQYVQQADVVVTGEGRLDAQTTMGKAPSGIAAIAKKYRKPVIGFAGCVTEDAGACNAAGIDAFFPVLRSVCTLEEAMDTDNAFANMAATAEQVFRVIRMTKA